jgi:hypothetical protein
MLDQQEARDIKELCKILGCEDKEQELVEFFCVQGGYKFLFQPIGAVLTFSSSHGFRFDYVPWEIVDGEIVHFRSEEEMTLDCFVSKGVNEKLQLAGFSW